MRPVANRSRPESFISVPDRPVNPMPPANQDAPVASPLGHRLMFLLLALMSFSVFAPTILFPVLREHGDLLREERRLRAEIQRLDAELERRINLTEAFSNDKTLNERLAVLDLNYSRPDEVVVPVRPDFHFEVALPVDDEPTPRSVLRLPESWPAWSLTAEQWAQERGLIDLFFDSTLRPVFLLMSAGLLIAAFVLYVPTPQRRKSCSLAESQNSALDAPSLHGVG